MKKLPYLINGDKGKDTFISSFNREKPTGTLSAGRRQEIEIVDGRVYF